MIVSVITYFDLVQRDNYRDFVSKRLAQGSGVPYCFPNVLPKLYQYKPLTNYVVDDICSGQITASSIGEFNDLFDGAIHCYGSEKERLIAAERQWGDFKSLSNYTNISETGLNHDLYVGLYKEYYKNESRLSFRMLDYLDTYVSCFSSEKDSNLMWSHYAKSNTGICVEYNFNKLPQNHLLPKTIFPVCYTNSPVDLSDLLDDEKQKLFDQPLDVAVLCASLNKSSVWSYEKEWRLVWVLAGTKEFPRRLPLKTTVLPTTIYFGYHFLRPLFYYERKREYTEAKNNIEQLLRIIDYMNKHNITMCIMIPSIGQYSLKPCGVKINRIKNFLIHNFKDNEPEYIRYYHTIHDCLKELLDENEEIQGGTSTNDHWVG